MRSRYTPVQPVEGHPASYFAVDSEVVHQAGGETVTGTKDFTGGATFNDAQVANIDLIAGINWALRTSAADNDWQSVCYGNGMFVAVAITGVGNRVMSSPDGINWTSQTSAANNSWNSVCYGNGLFVAVSYTGTGNRVMTSPDGIVWTSRTSAADYSWSSVCYGNGIFVAVGYSGTGDRVMTSPDGITWTSRTSAADNAWTAVAYGNGVFVAVAATGTGDRVMTSPDGITWTIRTSAADNEWYSVTYGNGLFVAISRSGSGNRVMTSPDGITWTSRTSAANYSWFGVTYGNGLFVAVSYGGVGNRVMTSPDGIVWSLRTSAVDNSWRDVCYGNGIFVSVAASGTGDRVATSGKEIEHLELDPDHSHTHIAGQEILTAADIVEGTFTPTIVGGTTAGTGTYTVQSGIYQKIGNRVHFSLSIAWTAHTGTGNMLIGGLPHTPALTEVAVCAVEPDGLTYAGDFVNALIVGSVNQFRVRTGATGATVAAVPIDTSAAIKVSGSYLAA